VNGATTPNIFVYNVGYSDVRRLRALGLNAEIVRRLDDFLGTEADLRAAIDAYDQAGQNDDARRLRRTLAG